MTAPDVLAAVDAAYDHMVDTRHTLHSHPELSFAEHATTALVRERMAELGVSETAKVTATGGMFVLEGGRPGRTVVLRADLDALPVHEDVDLPWRSTTDGVMHACGHDVHTASLLGVAEALADRAEALAGRYVFVFQPAEEALGGAASMVAGGGLEQIPQRATARLIGYHVSSLAPTGFVGLRSGITMADARSFHIVLEGEGGHGAMPAAGGDVIRAVARVIDGLAPVVDGLHYEGTDCVCTAGRVRAGTAVNVVPGRAVLEGTVRTFTAEQSEGAMARLHTLCADIAAQQGLSITIQLPAHTPAVVNDPAVTSVVHTVAHRQLPTDRILAMPPVAPSDDVSELLARVPGCYFFVGGGNPSAPGGTHHSSTFSVEDESMRTGARLMAGAAATLGEDDS